LSKSIYNEEYRRLISALKAARIERGITQQHVADAVGKPQSFVAKIEGRERRLDVIEFIQICRVIGCDPMQLLAPML
jgi:transcriptional regulator with XRE-family HTH domain